MLRKTYAEVDLDCIAHNIRALRRAAGTPVMAVVKADAYGHGMQAVARRALREVWTGLPWRRRMKRWRCGRSARGISCCSPQRRSRRQSKR